MLLKKWSLENFKENMWSQKLEINKVLKSYIQQILGVNKKTSNNGLLTECGKFPLCMKAYIQIIRYWVRLQTLDNKYMQELLKSELNKVKKERQTWLKVVEFLIKYTNCDINDIQKEDNPSNLSKFQNEFEQKIKRMFKQYWQVHMNRSFEESKMEFLCEYKRNFMFETYIDNLNYENRKTVSRFRLSNHNLPIEKLRYENIKREDRLCEICNLHNVGNENHYMLECQSNDMKDRRENFVDFF